MVRDLVEKDEELLDLEEASTVVGLKQALFDRYESLKAYNNFSVAVNESYAEQDQRLQPGDVIALIPPVSGG